MRKRNEQLQARLRTASPKVKAAKLRPFRNYKDRIFRMIYKDEEKFLELYNALNGTDYDNPEDLVVKTLDNAIYLGMKNDVAFLIYDELALYEHQSTMNPNMPLRDLFYVSHIYEELVNTDELYGEKLVHIPMPQFAVFYNGVKETPEQFELKLSDAYGSFEGEPKLELKVKVYNINYGCNAELMEKCKSLKDYAIFVAKSRQYMKQMDLQDAIELTIAECIREDIMADFLRRQRAEVFRVSLFEFDQERYIKGREEAAAERGREEGRQAGRIVGREEGTLLLQIHQVRKKMEKGLSIAEIADMLEEKEDRIQKIYDVLSTNVKVSDENCMELVGEKVNM